MIPEAEIIWSALEFRKPMLLRNIEPLSEQQCCWIPAPGRVSISWQLWHIAEVEDIWVREKVLEQPLHFPFGVQVRAAQPDQIPAKSELINYLHEVRELTRKRLEAIKSYAELCRPVIDEDFGQLMVRDIWSGVITSFAWHAGQIALTAKLIPDTPVATLKFKYWQNHE